ncbi:MAG: PRC-barrel domain-containing protein [Methanomassiliicoccales archaeon]|nr:PRC-barrel domain-containing protein [Methanomassiliicoccales archaeon]
MGALLNKKVMTSDAFEVGTVDAFDLDLDTWKITHVGVTLNNQSNKELGVRKPLLGGLMICIPVANIDKIGDVMSLNLKFTELKNIPECKLQ